MCRLVVYILDTLSKSFSGISSVQEVICFPCITWNAAKRTRLHKICNQGAVSFSDEHASQTHAGTNAHAYHTNLL